MSTLTVEHLHALGHTIQRARVSVPTRDGVLLAADVYWPAGCPLEEVAPATVLLERTPYGIRADRPSDGRHADGTPVTPVSGASFFVDRGYIVVRQDCRGRGDSQGTFSKYVGEAADGRDTHAWIGEQPWCNGQIVTHGVSYSAHTQTAAASVSAPHIGAMIVDSGGFSNAYESGGRFGGAFELKQVTWALRRAATAPDATGKPAAAGLLEPAHLSAWFAAMPWRKGFSPLSAVPEYEDFLFDQWAHEDLDDYWKQPGLYACGYYDKFPAAPMLSISSWYDPYVFTALDNFRALRAKDARTSLIMGPWTHGARSLTYAGDVDFGPSATFDHGLGSDYLTFKADWFDAVLAGGRPALAPVTYFVMGGGSGRRTPSGRLDHGGAWQTAGQWPPEGAKPVELYLHEDQSLSRTPPETAGSVSYDFDPRHPVPSIGGGITSGEPLMSGGAFDQTPGPTAYGTGVGLPLSSRHDVLAFQTEPLIEPVVVAGGVNVELQVSSSAPDTDISAKLIDVYPPSEDYPEGYAMNITDGLLRCRYRGGFEQAELMEPGEVYTVTIRLPDTANQFAAGHRIRLDISSSNFPRCDVNPNTGKPVMGDRTSQIARNTIHFGISRLRAMEIPQREPSPVVDDRPGE